MRRSMLFLPGNTPNMLINGNCLGADAVIFDLEDAVSPTEKDAARILVRNTMRYMDFRGCEIIVRINSIDTPYWKKDVDEILPYKPALILLPKTGTAADALEADAYISQVEEKLGYEKNTVGLMPLIETALGVENAFAIASSTKRVKALFLGAEDLTADLQCKRTKESREIEYARTRLVVAARAAGVDVYDTPFTDVNDDEGIVKDATYAKALGFTGKASISPRHVEVINAVFSPTQKDVDYAYEVMEAISFAKEQGRGAIALHGKMIDAPIVARAQQTIAMAEALGMEKGERLMSKVVSSIKEVIALAGLKDGMTVSFHHHLRNGDFVLNMVMEEIAAQGYKDINVNASSLFDVHTPILEHIQNGVVTGIAADYIAAGVGRAISQGILAKPVQFRTHGGRPSDISLGRTPIDVAFIAAPTSDTMGNCSGKYGKSACGSLGYAYADAMYAKKVVVITDNLVPYPLQDFSISEDWVDYVVAVEAIGNPKGIVSGTTQITRDPVGLVMASHAAQVIAHSGLLKDGFSFQTGAGGASLAAAKFLKDIMLEKQIQGSFGLGGITGYMVDMLHAGCFRNLMDVQCFDLKAVESLRTDPRHQEISAMQYASPSSRSAVVDSLDVVILGATEIDTDFNVNVHTDSNGYIMGGSGGHSDTAAGAKLSMIIAPMFRARLPIVTDRVNCISTPGKDIDVLVTQGGIAVNPKNADLASRLSAAGLPIIDIHELKEKTERITGKPHSLPKGDRVVADVISRDGELLDQIYNVK